MVRIIDGEIMADDDPRVAAASAGSGGGGAAGPRPAQGGGAAPRPDAARLLDFDAPVLRLAPDDGTGLAGMPALLLWGMRVPPQHLLLLLGAGLMFGWRGGVFAVLLYMWWRASSAGAAAGTAQQPPTQQRMAAAQDYFSRVLQQEPLGRGGAAPGEERRGAGADPWAARGKPRCLNDQ
ncbi:chromodomain-helicase-DNA-binding 1 [Micractinium conductrix]|uniref:Chromodomain-helicase-DNA-binding 1 n=1 Tax=Micractinium conductrix TaxID=554055 RepID=A0A2P6VB34_9CHLO|nr:chromodomain-helicase-DNA-binding 1 [Micractinium conductrix]|eukprot:PSC71294.1 chromodomain-helicase-DNA-binding 1 [Micractinium conductrix]